ncbi:MAG: N-acetyl-1-D-myo-inositol-2-amino-2-deoxy-alpha-D-glucopyranoside deacetylase [Kineosporiaceae bacterium]
MSTPTSPGGRRLLLVHAHPDDESITTGATMALYAASGAQVVLVTCTRGEQGEVIPSELAHLAADRDDTLGAHREYELAAAMAALGVRDHRFLGVTVGRRYRDSGMTFDAAGAVVMPDDARPDAFARADVDRAAGYLAEVIADVRPQVVVTYDPTGGYGHPDHVQTHRVTMRALALAGAERPGWTVPKVYWVVDPDDAPTAAVDGTAFLDAKAAALRAHVTQIVVDEPYFALSNEISQLIEPVEYFRRVGGPSGPETDLFAGL